MSEENMENTEAAPDQEPQAVPEQPAAEQQPSPAPEMRGFKEQFSAAFASAKEKFMPLLAVGFIGIVLIGVLGFIWAKAAVGMVMQSPVMFALAPMIGILIMWVPMLLMLAAAFMLITGVSSSAVEAYAGAFRKLPGMLLIYILLGLALPAGFALLLVPGVILSVWFYPVFFVYVKEGLSPVDSLVQSREYARGNFKLIFLRLLALGAVSFLLLLLGSLMMVVPLAGQLAFMLWAFFISVLFFAYSHELYADLSASPGMVRVGALPSGRKGKVMALPIGCAVLGAVLLGVSVFQQASAVKDSPMADMMELAANAENLSEEEMQARMQEMITAQLQQAAQDGNMPPEAKAMLQQMAGSGKAAKPEENKPAPAAKPEEKKPAEQPKPAGKAAELTSDQKAAAEAFRKALEDCLSDGDWVVRRDAVAAIGHLGLREFVPQLNRMTRDRNAAVRSEASKALLKVRYTR